MVFRCRQSNPDREVAVKVLKPLLDVDEQQSRFQREMAAVSAINENGMAAVYQTGIIEWGGVRCLWMAMELLNGGTICDYIRQNSISEREVLVLFQSVSQTLRAAHRVGILHRDIKPSNILMSKDGMPHLVDFGIAKLPGSFAGVQPTEPGTFSTQGTAAWMAPELLLADKPVQADVRSEIFRLGVVLFEMLSGQHPYAAERLTVPQVAARIAQREQTSLLAFCPKASRDLVAFNAKLVAFDAAERYQNLDDVLNDLDLLQNGEPVKARFVSARERIWRWCYQRPRTMVATIALGFALLFAVVYVSRQAEKLAQATQRMDSARANAGRYLRLLKALNIRPAMAAPQKPGDLDLQLQLLREATEAFEEFLFQWPEDREIRQQAGSAFHLLGIAENRLERFEESLASFRHAEQIFADLKRDYPEDRELEFDLFHTVLGQSGTMQGTRESVELRKWCLQLMRRLHSEEPENTDYTDALACVLGDLGFDYSRPTEFQNLTLARELILESRQTALTLSSQPECNPLHRKHVATSAASLRVIEYREGNYAEAQRWSGIAVEAQARFIQDFPDPDSKSYLIRYHNAHARDSLCLNQVIKARESVRQAVKLFKEISPLLVDSPALEELRKDLTTISTDVEMAESDAELKRVPAP